MHDLAVRTVAEDDDTRTIEGLAYPFKGKDTYGTFFSARTDFHWDLFPDAIPDATRTDQVPVYVRPVTFHHGFDNDYGLTRTGGWSPVRMDDDGVWVRAQIDKRERYYEGRLKPLLDAGALGLSGGSAEHSVRIDQRSGEILEWPAYELALTPVESNPLAQLAARTGEYVTIVASRAEPAPPPPAIDPATTPIPAIALRYSPSAWDASAAAYTLASLLDLLGNESGETDQATALRTAIAAIQQFIALEQAEIGTEADAAEAIEDSTSISETITVSAWQAGTRTTEPQPEMVSITVRENVTPEEFEAVRARLLADAEKHGMATAIRMTDIP